MAARWQPDGTQVAGGATHRGLFSIRRSPPSTHSQVTQLDAPRILLLACPLEHERRSFTSSLEALRQQEEEHMGMVVEEIAKLQASRLASSYARKSVSYQVSQPASQSVSQSASQSVSQSV